MENARYRQRILRFDTLSDLHCRLFWAYAGRIRELFRNTGYQQWPPAAWLIRKGSVEVKEGETWIKASAGQWIFPGNKVTFQKFSADVELISIRFSIMWRTGEVLFPGDRNIVFAAADFPEFETVSDELLSVLSAQMGSSELDLGKLKGSFESHFIVMNAFHNWSHIYARIMSSLGLKMSLPIESDPRVETALSRLRDQPLTQPLCEVNLAQICGLSVSQLNRLFERYVGMSPMQYLQDRRLHVAEQALMNGERTIKSIAYELGFSSPPNFTTWFKKRHGVSPRQWIKSQPAPD